MTAVVDTVLEVSDSTDIYPNGIPPAPKQWRGKNQWLPAVLDESTLPLPGTESEAPPPKYKYP